jgi:3-methyladenine DNA glycosylase AlkD
MAQLEQVKKALRAGANPAKADIFPNFFKAGYSVDDKFLGVTVPKQRVVAKKYWQNLTLDRTLELLHSPWHEERLTALFILVLKFNASGEEGKLQIVNLYLANTAWVNNWDLVDSSAYFILGDWLVDKDRELIYKLVKSKNLWERRMAIVATMAFIRKGETEETFKIAQVLMSDPEDYIHKAVGWLLREAGKKDEPGLKDFLDKNAVRMPRTTLRYSIEKLNVSERKRYLSLKSKI